MTAAKRDKTLYRETYKAGTAVRSNLLPATLPFMTEGSQIVSMNIMAAGKVQRPDGDVLEYVEFRVYVRPPVTSAADDRR